MITEDLRELIKEAEELGYATEIVSEEDEVLKLEKNGKNRYVYGKYFPLNTTCSARISKDKNLSKKIISSIGINVPKGNVYRSVKKVEEDLDENKINFPLVAKPNSAALGTLVSVDINSKKDLLDCARLILNKYKEVLVEEFLPWNDHRIFVVDGVTVAVARRIQPFVVGDGKSTLSELIASLNKKKEKKKLVFDTEFKRYIKMQNLNLDDVIEKDKRIQLRGNANIQTGGFIEDVTDIMNDKFIKIAERVAKEFQMRLAGVDILCEDIRNEDSNYAITEINGMPSYPYIHDHPDIGESRKTFSKVLEAVFKDEF